MPYNKPDLEENILFSQGRNKGLINCFRPYPNSKNSNLGWLFSEGFYTNDSEYVRDIVRKDQERSKRMVDLNEALIEGMESGPSDATIDSIWEEALNEHNAGN